MQVSAYTSDKIRVIGLVLTLAVVFHHAHDLQFSDHAVAAWVAYPESFFHYGLRAWAVPFFYVCSAYFLGARLSEGGSWRGESAKRVRSLLIPFLLWSVGWLAVMWALQRVPSLAGRFGREAIDAHDPLQLLRLIVIDPIPHPLWYLRDLFVLTLLSPVVVWCMRRPFTAAVYFAGSLWLFYAFSSLEVRVAQDPLFFGIGAYLAVNRVRLPPMPSLGWPMLAAGIALVVWHCWWVTTYGAENIALIHTGALLGLAGLWLAYDDLAPLVHRPAMIAAARSALFIYLGHEPALSLLRKVALMVGGTSDAMLFAVWAGTAAAMIVGLAIVAGLLRAWLPWVYALLVGGRDTPALAKTQLVAAPRGALPA